MGILKMSDYNAPSTQNMSAGKAITSIPFY